MIDLLTLLQIDIPAGVQWPLWLIAVFVFLDKLQHYVPALGEMFGKKNCEQKIKELQQKYDNLKVKVEIIETEKIELTINYNMLFGFVSGIKTTLQDHGVETFEQFMAKFDKNQ